MRIGVVCPVHDTPPELLEAAVASVLGQDGPHVAELILVDDASTAPATRAALAGLAGRDARVRVLRLPANGGVAAARNAGAAAVTAGWIGFLDSDDLWLPGWPARAAGVLAAHPEARWIAGGYANLWPDGRWEAAPSLAAHEPGERLAPGLVRLGGPALTRRLIGDFWLRVGAILLRKDLFSEAGGFIPGLRYNEDGLFAVHLSLHEGLYLLETEAYGYRRGHASAMASPARLSRAYVQGFALAARDPRLAAFRREIRWARHSAVKGLALNNLRSGRLLAAAGFAFQAFLMDPRRVGEAVLFLRLMAARMRGRDLTGAERYSRAEAAALAGAAPP